MRSSGEILDQTCDHSCSKSTPASSTVALADELAGGEVVADAIEGRSCVFLRGLYLAERGIAERLRALGQGAPPWPAIDADKAIPWVEKKTGKTLAASQRAAIAMVAARQGRGRHRRPRRRQDDAARRHPADRRRQRRKILLGGADRPRRQANDRADRHRGKDHPPAARDRSQEWRFQTQRGEPA